MAKEPATARVRGFFSACGFEIEIKEFPAGTRTAQQAADAVDAPLGSIVKSLVFIAEDRKGQTGNSTSEPTAVSDVTERKKAVLALVSGDRRADAIKIARLVGAAQARIANADEVRLHTSFAIGGVPPAGHPVKLETLVDESLLRFQTVWAAAGTPQAVFEIEMEKLLTLTEGKISDIIATPG